MSKLYVDLTLAWGKQTATNAKLLIILLMLAVPVSILINFQLLQMSYLNPHFAGLSQTSPIYNIGIKTEKTTEALNNTIVEDIMQQWHYKIAFERTLSLLTNFNHLNVINKDKVKNISFFSGGYKALSYVPALGSFDKVSFPKTGSELVAAITYQEWQISYLGEKYIIGKKIMVNDKVVTIVAVMPKNFISFRKNQRIGLVMPYNQLPEILNNKTYSATPDTFSYIIVKERIDSKKIAQSMSDYMHEEVLLLDDANIIINKAIGINSQEYAVIGQRLSLLNVLFLLLLLFCFIAFITFYIGECSQKQQEYIIRSFCGANTKQLIYQRLLDILLTVVLFVVFCLFITPVMTNIAFLFFPELQTESLAWQLSDLLPLLFKLIVIVFLLMAAVFFMQEKLIKTTVGRGNSLSLSQKIQSYVLLSFMLYLALMATYTSLLLLQSQQKLLKTDLGFSVNSRYLITFDFPRLAQKKYHANEAVPLLLKQLEQHAAIKKVAITNMPPLWDRTSFRHWYTSEGVTIGTGIQSNTLSDTISPNYFSTLETQLVKGTTLTWQAPFQVVVNKSLWQRFFADKKLLEAKLLSVNFTDGTKIAYQVVGVVEDILLKGADNPAEPIVYSISTALTGFETFLIESDQNTALLEQTILSIVQQQNVAFQGIHIESLTALVEQENRPRMIMFMISMIATVIVFFAALIFCYTLIMQLANKNSRELALRYSMGADLFTLIKAESLIFLGIFLPLSIPCFYLYHSQSELLLSYLVATPLMNFPMLSAVFLSTILIFIFLLSHQFKKKIENSWHYLS